MPKRNREDSPAGRNPKERGRETNSSQPPPKPKEDNSHPFQPACRHHDSRDCPYADARDSLNNNEFLKSLNLSHGDFASLRQIQTTYKVQLTAWPDQGPVYKMMLIWDYDRVWGSFEFGHYNGTLLVDPGPASAEDEGRSRPLEWRGTSPLMPNTLINSDLTTGEITLGGPSISGHFNVMPMGGKDRCEFTGTAMPGPVRVSRSLQSFIDEWNDIGILNDEETIRLPPDSERGRESPGPNESPEPTESSEQDTRSESSLDQMTEDQNEFLASVTGIFKIKSRVIEDEWPERADWLSIRFHVDHELDRVWGAFHMGIDEGYLLFHDTPADLEPGVPLKFRWRARGHETGDQMSGEGEVSIGKDRKVEGGFYGMYGDEVDFAGRRKLMSSNVSGYGSDCYSRMWREYKYGLSGWR